MTFVPRDEDYAARVRASFARQGVMGLLGATLGEIGPGSVEILLPHRPDLTQQHGFFHAGVTATIADNAAGFAAFTLFPAETSVLTSEFKLHLLAPADGERLRAVGRVLKPGRTLTVCEAEVFVLKQGREKLCAKLIGTLVLVGGRPDIAVAG